MITLNPIKNRRIKKLNPVEFAMRPGAATGTALAARIPDLPQIRRFLKNKYGISDVTPIATFVCNNFFSGIDRDGRRLFIKIGHHHGIYENEYRMGMALYKLDRRHFLAPRHWHDYDKYNFFANDYVDGITLKAAVTGNTLTDAQRAQIISDIWDIFCALRRSDVVHRDIRPDNLMIIDGRLVLIDFQLAVSKSNYVELDYLTRRPNRLRKLGNKYFRYRRFTWDDAYSLGRVMKFVGRRSAYAAQYDKIYREIRRHIGRDTIRATNHESDLARIVRHIKTFKI